MEIRLNKAWVIYSSANESGIILGKIPEKQQETYINSSKFAGQKYHYSTIFGAVQGAFKHGLNSSDSQSFLDLEKTIERIAKDCQNAFTSENLKVLHSEKVEELQSEIELLKAQLKKKVAQMTKDDQKLWAVNIPEEPDSELLHPIPSKEMGEQLVYRLKSEALQTFPKVGQCIADSITLEEWNGTQDDHTKYLQENKEWWHDTTFLEQAND